MRNYGNPNSNPKHATPLAGNGNREPFPPPSPLLEHPHMRILKYPNFGKEDFDPADRVLVPLARDEIRMLALHYLDTVYSLQAYIKAGGSVGSSDFHRDDYYRCRFVSLADLLSEEDQKAFGEIARDREKYIETLRDPEEEQE